MIPSGFPADRVNTFVVMEGEKPLADAILEFRCELSCCTVVVGRGHKSKTEEFLFGSLSNQLIHLARNCAVWVVE
jgi:nucleotide-binding universal stress UspA family protein